MQNPSGRSLQKLSISPGLLIVFVFYALGICLAEQLDPPTSFVWHTVFFVLCFLFCIHRGTIKFPPTVSCLLLGLLFFLLGLLQFIQSQPVPPSQPNHVYNLIKNQQTVSIEGVLIEYPSVIDSTPDPVTRLLIEVVALYQNTTDQHPQIEKHGGVSGRILLTLNGLLPENIIPGDHLIARATLSRVHTYSTPGSFNYKEYLANQSIFIKGWIQSPQSIIKIHQHDSDGALSSFKTLYFFPEKIRRHLALFLDDTLQQPARGLYKAILIGDRNDVPVQILENFTGAGCLHILAISGMHMGLLALITIASISWLLKRSVWIMLHVPVHKVAVAIAFPPLLFYALIAGGNIPVMRALIMTGVLILAVFFDRPENLINHLLAAALLILVWKPRTIFSASFQLSFCSVTAISLIYPRLYKFFCLNTLKASAETVNYSAADDVTSVGSILHTIQKFVFVWFTAAITLTTAAILGTLPLLLFHFNRFSPASPLSNLLVEPLICFWSLLTGLAASLCLPVFPVPAKALFIAGGTGLSAAARICTFFSALPYSSIWLPTPSLLEVMVFYLFLLLLIISMQVENSPKRYLLIPAFVFLCFATLCPSLNSIIKHTSRPETSVTFIDVGHGSSILLKLPGPRRILIDGGGNRNERFNIGERVIGPFLWQQKLDHLDEVIITHPHADHFNGLPFILTRFHPEKLWINGSTAFDDEYGRLLELADELAIDTAIARTGDILYQSGRTRLICIQSGPGKSGRRDKTKPHNQMNQNDLSIVLRLDIGGSSFLFPADISASKAETLVNEGKQLQAEVLMAPHHGSSSSLSRKFIEKVAPKYIVISVGRNYSFNFPAESYFDMKRQGIKVLSTYRDGTITFTMENPAGGKLKVDTYQVN